MYVCMSQKPQTLKCPTKTKPNQINLPEQNKTKENKTERKMNSRLVQENTKSIFKCSTGFLGIVYAKLWGMSFDRSQISQF